MSIQKGNICLLLFLLFGCSLNSYSQQSHQKTASDEMVAIPINLEEQLQIFGFTDPDARYYIRLCADVPNNKRPLQVAYHQQCGHVFIILQKINRQDTISKVFGFYPKHELPTLFFKTIKSKIRDNSEREYDVEIWKQLSADEFDTVLAKAISYSRHIYHINKFNCYDYAIKIFNSAAYKDSLPVQYTRFPFIFGRGGSPCCIYKELKRQEEVNSVWAQHIRFGELIAPVSTGRLERKD